MKITRILAAAAAALALALPAMAADEEIDTSAAMAATHEWLAHMDAARYGAAWESCAESFRKGIERMNWEINAETARAPLGVHIARRLRSASFTRTLPGAPEGEYVLVQFDARFEKRPLALELVTIEREKDGSWRVAGYAIR